MPLVDRQLREVWDALRAQQAQRSNVLRAVRIRRLRGIRDLRVPFNYPVCVLAGPNGCGKSTVLFSCASAYRDPARGPREFVPTSLFPNFIDPGGRAVSDAVDATELEFDYVHEGAPYAMAWRRGKSWNRSFLGRKGGRQPERSVYLRTLANLTNPSEVRGLLQLARKPFETREIGADLLVFAHRILPREYRRLSLIRSGLRDLLFAEVAAGSRTGYSEFHMSSGERAVLRISQDISSLDGALVLIDEVEAGLHPYTQQQTMLELQRLALRQELQIVVASHSPVVLGSVPPEARIFLDRDVESGEVVLAPAYRDIFQKALYGQSQDRLSILCEDEAAEALIRGVLDVLNPRLGLRHDDFVIGRNTGQAEFPGHVRTLGKFGRLRDFVMVLDGDSRSVEAAIRSAAELHGAHARPLFLPGDGSPEDWTWRVLGRRGSDYAGELGLGPVELARRVVEIGRVTEGAVQQGDRAKASLAALAVELDRQPADVVRRVGAGEAERGRSGMAVFLLEFQDEIEAWRRRMN